MHIDDGEGLRQGKDKTQVFLGYPAPTTDKEVDQFLYLTTFLQRYTTSRAEHARILKKQQNRRQWRNA